MNSDFPATLFSLSPKETFQIAKRLSLKFKGGELIILEGELGMGKTIFTKGIAAGLGIDPNDITSPSFLIINEHQGSLKLYHIDLYRLKDAQEIEDLGIRDLLEIGAVIVIEWGERLPHYFRRGGIHITFFDMGEDSRKIVISKAEDNLAAEEH
jgi:tRNA threonylcarbamoyladenosine biosynthesis protein TsaE